MNEDTEKPRGKPKPGPVTQRARRALLRAVVTGVGVTIVALAGFVPVIGQWAKRLRPPGALEEREFLASCIKCGQCVQVCPVAAIVLADVGDGFGVGTPYLDARAQACDFSCDAVQCVLACPTGSLSHKIDKKEQVRMGLAHLSRPDACLARQGKGFKGTARGADFAGLHRWISVDRWKPIAVADYKYDLEICDLCVRECPIKDAIALVPMSDDPADKRRTPKVLEPCVGCGMCEMMCPVDPTCIVVDPGRKWSAA